MYLGLPEAGRRKVRDAGRCPGVKCGPGIAMDAEYGPGFDSNPSANYPYFEYASCLADFTPAAIKAICRELLEERDHE